MEVKSPLWMNTRGAAAALAPADCGPVCVMSPCAPCAMPRAPRRAGARRAIRATPDGDRAVRVHWFLCRASPNAPVIHGHIGQPDPEAPLLETRPMWRNALLVTGLLTACSRGANAPESANVSADAAPPPSASMVTAPAEQSMMVGAVKVAGGATAAEPKPLERMIVRTASMRLQVADVRRAAQQAIDATNAVNGFIGSSRAWRDGDQDRASLTLRVPSKSLDATLATLRNAAVRVDDESVSGEDVTRQAVDLTAQLTNLRATETELRALLTTVRINAKRASEVLEVHAELTRIRGEIEQQTAQLQSLTQLAALSTISLELMPDVIATPIGTEGWQPVGVLRDATRALVATVRTGINAGIWIVVYGVPMLLVLTGMVMLGRSLRRRMQRTSVASVG
jgi:Domain of unknown function (DUF4349)